MIDHQLLLLAPLAAALLMMARPAAASPNRVRVGDAFVRGDAGGRRWTIGTAAMDLKLDCRDGRLRVTSLRNRLTAPARELIDAAAAEAPFNIGPRPGAGAYAIETVWEKALPSGGTVDAASDGLRVSVRKGDLLGFGVATFRDDAGASVAWANSVDYGDGEIYDSSSDKRLDQGPVWFTYIRDGGTGCMELLGETVPEPELARVPSGYRAPFECSRITATGFQLVSAFEMVRVWKAPKDGTVTICGVARHTGGAGAHLRVMRIGEKRPQAAAAAGWALETASARQVAVGGRPAVQLDLTVRRGALRAILHVQAYPGASILRQWVELENASAESLHLGGGAPLVLPMAGGDADALTHYWMCGGTSRPNQGQLATAAIGASYHRALLGDRSDNYVPWTALLRQGKRDDGVFVALDHLGTWSLSLDGAPGGLALSATAPELAGSELAPGGRLRMPLVTLGVFRGDLDDMGRRVYDWQYEYLWDHTNAEFFARTKWAVPWFFCSRNLQEQFAARLAGLDMDADLMRTLGIEMLWDDAGWSKYPGWPIPDNYSVVFSPSNEGPDFAETLRYLGKMGMNWLLWFAGRPSAGVMDTKVGSWGGFQWRTDGFGRFGLEGDRAIRGQFEHFLTANPGSSFHTCDGGSRYAHQFEIQRYADVNYLSDMGRDAKTNHYLSYIDLPDKWLDIIDPLTQGGRYLPDTAFGQLSMAPAWYAQVTAEDREPIRRLMELYRYLREQGVVGRWSYMMHPRVTGDADFYFDQRTSHDRQRACILLKHKTPAAVTVYPHGLLPEFAYTLGDGSRTGGDLMAHGIAIPAGTAGGAIVLGLPHAPGTGHDTQAPSAPGTVYARRETNLGHSGVALYWSPGADDNWVSYYEVRRGEAVIGKASVGTYYFDHAPGWNASAAYAVRTVDGDGNASDWAQAVRLDGGQDAYAALGGHFAEAGRDGWGAEASANGATFGAMRFVPPAKSPAGDLGGTPNQSGGVEGYWEGAGKSRVGRGWQQASPDEECIRTWTAPRAGAIRVVGRAMRECYHQALGGSLRVRILRGSDQIWPDAGQTPPALGAGGLWAEVRAGDWLGVMHDLALDVAAGDTIRFVLDRGQSPENDLLAWMPRIEYASAPPAAAGSVVRILCGSKAPYTDRFGNAWSADRYAEGGRAAKTEAPVTSASPTPTDPRTYEHCREGEEFVYSIPVAPGLYAVRLRFAETRHQWASERPMNVSINGRRVLEDFDICQAARGARLACERVFHNLAPNADGRIVIRFMSGWNPRQVTDRARVNAIEVLPDTKPTVRIDAGSETQFVDWNSFRWSADRCFEGGQALRSEGWTAHASPTLYDQALYQTARAGKTFGYSVPVPAGMYTVHLKFAELWLKEAGQRPMNIEINGCRVRTNWDPAAAAGQVGMAADFRVPNVTPDAAGHITIRLTAAGSNDAILQGIEIE